MKISLPEQVWLDFEPATFGSRGLAFVLDFLIRWISIALVICAGILFLTFAGAIGELPGIGDLFGDFSQGGRFELFLVFITLLFFLVEFSYPIYFEVKRQGVTPGKRMLGLRVVDERGLPVSFRASFLRTIFVMIDLMPGMGLTAFASMVASKRSQRVGDLVAKTLVVHEVSPVAYVRGASGSGASVTLPAELYGAIEQYLGRRDGFSTGARSKFLKSVHAALLSVAPTLVENVAWSETDDRWLEGIFERCRPERSQGESTSSADTDWGAIETCITEFEAVLAAFESNRGVSGEQDTFQLASSYQALCQQYAFLQTFYPRTAEAVRAAQLVRRGRQIIYGTRLSAFRETSNRRFMQRIPDSYRAISMHTLIATSLAIAGAVVAALFVNINPRLSWFFLNEDVAANLAAGKLWTDDIQGKSSLVASQIMTNNIKVTFSAFALGITGGIGTLAIMIFNGVHLGGVFASLTQYEMAFRLLDFVVAHGFLELSIIFVAGGSGLYLGDAILNPGLRTRKQAVHDHGKVVIDLLLFNAACLVFSGLVEGFISPYPFPFAFKLVLGFAFGAVYWWYLLTGRPFRREQRGVGYNLPRRLIS